MAVNVRSDGVVEVVTGTASAGQEHGVVFSELVTRFLPVAASDVVVIEGDTAMAPTGDGTMGSRSIQIAGSAVLQASEEVSAQARRLAARLLEASEDDVVAFPGEGVGVLSTMALYRLARNDNIKGQPIWSEIARAVDRLDDDRLTEEETR